MTKITDDYGCREYALLIREIWRTERDGGVTRSFHCGNSNLSNMVWPNQHNLQVDNGVGYQYTYNHKSRVLVVVNVWLGVLSACLHSSRSTKNIVEQLSEQTIFFWSYSRFWLRRGGLNNKEGDYLIYVSLSLCHK